MEEKKKKILLIYPPSPVMNREDRCQQPTKELLVIPPLPPTDLMYLAAVAEKAGLDAKIADYSQGGNFENDLKEFQPDYLLINVATPTFKNDLSSLTIAKEICPDIITIAKGAAFLTVAFEVMYFQKDLDLILFGEPEETLREVLEGKEFSKILGLYYRDDLRAKFTGPRPFIDNLDKLPFPARHLVDNNIYRRPDNNKVQAVIKVSRGCPFHCFFCLATPVSGAKVRKRSPENIIEEIRECVDKYGITNFLFWSDIFNIDKDWVMELCQKIIDSGLKITWSANTRADTADEEMANKMYEAGCRLVSIGVESGSQEMLDKIGKRITLDDVRLTVKIFKKAGIRIYNYFVIGLPWEDEDTVEDTIDFAIELDSDFISFYTATPLPGSKFYEYAKENNLINSDTSFSSAYFYPSVNTHYLTKERVFQLHKKAIRKFYLRPAYIIRMLSRIRSFTEFKNYFKAGLGVLLRR
ncbi:TPA: radical SAM protein [Candidatus Scatousia excrementigallinarum]|uniref:Radical SAM protein n=1 Tax=Candidatus Scatousia excrementigallinarum TaxID=2840935 RepID=A0A9D1JMF3_9BACT|nr:radical SAM protein [Candidatus Scatousia excrementigallinarum]